MLQPNHWPRAKVLDPEVQGQGSLKVQVSAYSVTVVFTVFCIEMFLLLVLLLIFLWILFLFLIQVSLLLFLFDLHLSLPARVRAGSFPSPPLIYVGVVARLHWALLCVMHQSTHSAEEPGVDKLPRTLPLEILIVSLVVFVQLEQVVCQFLRAS